MKQDIYINARFLTQQITGVQRFEIGISLLLMKMNNAQYNFYFLTPKNVINKDLAKELNAIVIGSHKGHYWEQVDLRNYLVSLHSPLLINMGNTGPIFYNNQLIMLHDVSFMVDKWHSYAFRTFYKFMVPKLLKKSTHILTVSEFSKKEIEKYFKIETEKISVIYSASPFNNSTDFNTHSLANNINTDNKRFILSVGSIDPRKNLKRIVKSFLRLDRDDIVLFLTGPSNKVFAKDNELMKIIDAHSDKVKFLGFVSDIELIQLYSNAEFFLYPSLYEGFGLPPIEAMMFGCPVLTSNRCSMPEVCGEAAIYCNPEDENDIVEKMKNLIDNDELKRKLSKEGIQQANKYSWDNSVNSLYKVLNKIK